MEHNELRVYYSSTFFNSGDLQKFAIQYLAKLPTEVTCLLSRGSSGCAIAFCDACSCSLSIKSLSFP